MHRYLLHNDEIRDAADRGLSPGQVGLLSGWGVFSTLRVYDGVMFAWERHWKRIQADAARMRVPCPSEPQWLESRLQRLIEANQSDAKQPLNATLRVVLVRNRGGIFEGPGVARDFDVIAFTVDPVRWPSSMKLGLVPHGRHAASEFAGTKYISWAENLTRYERAHDQGLDEVVLLNERGEVSECTSANIFIVEAGGSRVWTPPLSSGCLAGVTRAILLEEVRVPGVTIGEKALLPADLSSASEVFVTSTTRELLPVSSIEGINLEGLNANRASGALPLLRQAFSESVASYVNSRRNPVYNL
jgi:branched-chain amino acid aminotransferase